MPVGAVPQRTPLRRISQGSLFRLSRSGAYPDAPHGLGFLEPALSELVDEAEALHTNVQGLKSLSDALGTFNESFASWLYVMNMNALTTDWPQAWFIFSISAKIALYIEAEFSIMYRHPQARHSRLQRTEQEDAIAAMEAIKAAQAQPAPPSPEVSTGDKTTMNADTSEPGNETTFTTTSATASALTGTKVPVKKKGKPKLTAKEKKERALLVDKVVSVLPLEFRGSDPNLRRHIEMVIEGFLNNKGRGLGILELVKPPDLSQARVNKCLIALVARKIVRKDNSTGAVLYHWHGLPA